MNKNFGVRYLSLWMPVVIWAGLIFYLSSIPHLRTPWGIWDLIVRKIAHMVEYGILYLLVYRAVAGTVNISFRWLALISFCVAVLYAVSDEIHQLFIIGRAGNAIDVCIDSIGALVALVVTKSKMVPRLVCLFLLGMVTMNVCGCGPKFHFTIARIYEKKHLIAQANHQYQEIIDRFPRHAAEALYNMAENFRKDEEYETARRIYTRVIQKYPESSWAKESMQGLMNAPDYFPLKHGLLWVEGDSQTGGDNLKIFWNSIRLKNKINIEKKYYAGKQLVKELSQRLLYEKKDYELREYKDAEKTDYAVLIKYPVEKNLSWRTKRDGQEWIFRILATDAAVSVKAGKFDHCIKIAWENVGFRKSVMYQYYAPYVGWVLTTIKSADSDNEYRNTELLSFKHK